MHEAYRPMSLLVALWPTQHFQFPDDAPAFAERLRAQFALFDEHRLIQAPGHAAMPPEMPRLTLMGEQRHWALELAPAKVTLRRGAPGPTDLGALFDGAVGPLVAIQSWMAENLDFRIYRIGALVQVFCETRSSANEKIADYLLHPRALQGQSPHEIHLNVLSRVTLEGGTMANRWFRVRPLRSNDPRRVDFAAQIEVDINTMAEDTTHKTTPDVTAFLDAVRGHIDREIPMFDDEEFVA